MKDTISKKNTVFKAKIYCFSKISCTFSITALKIDFINDCDPNNLLLVLVPLPGKEQDQQHP